MGQAEAEEMAQELGLSYQDFCEQYTRTEYAPHIYLKEVPSEHGMDCIMLEREATPPYRASCKLHKHRPKQCRTWPFWPNNLRSPGAWSATARRCPGFNRGSLFSAATIEATCADSGLEIIY